MRNILKRTLGRRSEDQKGFTLIELLVVVGIIVALAAVIVPLVIQFSGKGDEGAWATEKAVVQAAIDTMMADETAASITARAIAAAVDGTEDLGILPAPALTLSGYIRDLPTTCLYTWDAVGFVTQDDGVGALCEVT